MALRKHWFLIPLGLILVLTLILGGLWLARARLAGDIAENYFREHGIPSAVHFDRLGLSGVTGRIALGPADAPDFSADSMEVDFDPLSLVPRIVAIRLVHPVLRARLDETGKVSLPALQAWLDSLQSSGAHSRYVSDDLAVSLKGLNAFLATPAGPLELDGDVRLQHNALVSATLDSKPATLDWHGTSLRLSHAHVKLDAIPGGFASVTHVEASLKNPTLESTNLVADISAPQLILSGKDISVPTLNLKLTVASLTAAGTAARNAALEIAGQKLNGTSAGDISGEIAIKAGADFSPDTLALPLPDPRLIAAVRNNLRHLDVTFSADVAKKAGQFHLVLKQPAQINGVGGAHLRLASFALDGAPAALDGHFDAALDGPGLPVLALSSHAFHWRDGALDGDAALQAHFSFGMLQGADIAARGNASLKEGAFRFTLGACAPVSLSAFHPAASDLARKIVASLCPSNAPNILADASGWNVSALAKDAAFEAPLGNVAFTGGVGSIAFTGKGAVIGGSVAVTAAKVHDLAASHRFEPMSGSGQIHLDKGIWQGQFVVTDSGNNALGTASFHHAMASGVGALLMDAPHLQFARGKLQPTMLSPLLNAVTRAEGAARFQGEVDWTPDILTSHGTLTLDRLDFLTPLGTAHAINATIALISLLPPATAPGQHIAISKVDWTLPLSGIAVDFSFAGGALKVDGLSSNISEGDLKLGAFTIDLAGPPRIAGAADLADISLAPLVAASNLDGKIKLDGKVTGKVPFTLGPEGFHITNGHLAATGPGRISVARSVWESGGATASNAVQDIAYQAMENLAFDQLSADINSIPGGRLQVVFHIKGHSDPPKPQQAEIAVVDIVNGSALQKTIALPSNTPIDLTLDTSLNFDELLQSYSEAWSKTLGARSN